MVLSSSVSAIAGPRAWAPMEWASRALRPAFSRILAEGDVRLDGDRPWDVRVHDERLFLRVALDGSLGLGDAYVDGWWDSERLRTDTILRCPEIGVPGLDWIPGYIATSSKLLGISARIHSINVRLRMC